MLLGGQVLGGQVFGADVPGAVVEVATEQVLDAASDLLDASEFLVRRGRLVEAFAVEGLQGRLLEAVVGAGRIETPGPPETPRPPDPPRPPAPSEQAPGR